MKKEPESLNIDYKKVLKVVHSKNNTSHFKPCERLIQLFHSKYSQYEITKEINQLYQELYKDCELVPFPYSLIDKKY